MSSQGGGGSNDMGPAHLTLKEEEVIKLLLEFLSNRELSISQLSVERETGIINGLYSEDALYLRQLILDGQWDDVLDFATALEGAEGFDWKQFQYIVTKHKYIELLCIRSESGIFPSVDSAVEEVVKTLADLERCCPSKEDYNSLCLLVTLPRLSDHFDYRNWNPSNARVNCFKSVFPLVEKFLPISGTTTHAHTAKGDRLIQLIIKGVLYESCVEYCQQRATSAVKQLDMSFSHILKGTGFSDSDLSLLSWLQCIPPDTFSYPFEQKTLSVDVEQLDKPLLEASWSEQILVMPIKPKIFPHSVIPSKRQRTDFMSKSLIPNTDVNRSMVASTGNVSGMSQSYAAGFHLTGKKAMNTSVDRLFEGGDVFSTSCADLHSTLELLHLSKFPKILEQVSPRSEDGSSITKTPTNERDILAETPTNEQTPLHTNSEHPNMSSLWRDFHRRQMISRQNETSLFEDNTKTQADIQATFSQGSVRELPTSTPKHIGGRVPTPELQNSPIPSRDDASSIDGSSLRSAPVVTRNLSAASNHSCDSIQASANLHSAPDGNATNSQKSSPGGSIGRGSSYSPSPADQDSRQLLQNSALKPSAAIHPFTNVEANTKKPHFVMVSKIEDAQAIRTVDFHPSGQLYAIGSNSKTLRICAYPKINELSEEHAIHQPTVLYKKVKHHKGSIYCLAWSQNGQLLATGSNDKTVKLMKFSIETCNVEANEAELCMHDGTVRDMCFVEDGPSSSLLVTGGAGDCKIYVTDCETATPFQALSGHSGHILALYTWGGAMFISGSQDKTIRFWDLRTKGCVHLVSPPLLSRSTPSSPVAAVCVDPSGRLLVSGQEDATCMLYDIRGGRHIQYFRPHSADVRSVRFSPRAYYLLTGSYDHKVGLIDLQGDLTQPLPTIIVAEHTDKVIQARWHPKEFSFLTTSADKTATLWALPMN